MIQKSNRMGLMCRGLHYVMPIAVAIVMVVGYSPPGSASDVSATGSTVKGASGTIHILNMTEYFAPGLLKKFTKDTGIKVVWDKTKGTAQATSTKLLAGGVNYDVVVLADTVVTQVLNAGLLMKIDAVNTLPNGKNIKKEFRSPWYDPNLQYTVPYAYGYEGYGYDSSMVDKPMTSWKDFFNPPKVFDDKINLHDDQDFVVNAALFAAGYKHCTSNREAYRDALEELRKLKPKLKIISSQGTSGRLGSGKVSLSTMWNGSFYRAWQQNHNLRFVIPTEGAMMFEDNLVILKNAANPKGAKAFINWYLNPKNAAFDTSWLGYDAPIKGITQYQDKDMRNNPAVHPDKKAASRGMLKPACKPDIEDIYTLLWTKFKG